MPDELDPGELLGLPAEQARAVVTDRGWLARVVAPGDLVTMDFREDRLTLVVDETGAVVRAYAG